MHAARSTGLVSLVSRCKLVSVWGLRKLWVRSVNREWLYVVLHIVLRRGTGTERRWYGWTSTQIMEVSRWIQTSALTLAPSQVAQPWLTRCDILAATARPISGSEPFCNRRRPGLGPIIFRNRCRFFLHKLCFKMNEYCSVQYTEVDYLPTLFVKLTVLLCALLLLQLMP